MSDTVTPFDGSGQNNLSVSVSMSAKLEHEPRTISAPTLGDFIQDLEMEVCAKINESGLFEKQLTVSDLRSKLQSGPYKTGRKICWLFLRNHPLAQLSFPRIGSFYYRDHTTVMSGHAAIIGAINTGSGAAFARIVVNVDDALMHRYGPLGPFVDVAFLERNEQAAKARREAAERNRPRTPREKIYELLKSSKRELTANSVAYQLDLGLSSVRAHLAILYKEGIATRRKDLFGQSPRENLWRAQTEAS